MRKREEEKALIVWVLCTKKKNAKLHITWHHRKDKVYLV